MPPVENQVTHWDWRGEAAHLSKTRSPAPHWDGRRSESHTPVGPCGFSSGSRGCRACESSGIAARDVPSTKYTPAPSSRASVAVVIALITQFVVEVHTSLHSLDLLTNHLRLLIYLKRDESLRVSNLVQRLFANPGAPRASSPLRSASRTYVSRSSPRIAPVDLQPRCHYFTRCARIA